MYTAAAAHRRIRWTVSPECSSMSTYVRLNETVEHRAYRSRAQPSHGQVQGMIEAVGQLRLCCKVDHCSKLQGQCQQ